MKKKVLLSSIATIAICLCLIAGSTFALFTDKETFDISVTSGDLEISAEAEINSVWSALRTDGAAEDEFLIDEKNKNYIHDVQDPDPVTGKYFFANGGEAAFDGANLVISRITPGDRVDVDIVVDNTSDIAIVYRYKIVATDAGLAEVMVITVDGVAYEGLSSWTSAWFTAEAGEAIGTKTISVELPVYVGNEYQSDIAAGTEKKVTYTITVEAVQGNAAAEDESGVETY